jgi:hypothetical protein
MHFMVGVWYLLALPLLVGISMVHKGLHLPEHGPWLKEVGIMTVQATLGVVALSLVLDAFVVWVLPVL